MKKLISFLLLFFALNVFSQKEANFWYFGFNAGLDFTDCNPVALENGELWTYEGCSTISSSTGELRFYSDGTTVWDKNHDVMPGGTGLRGNSSSAQSALFVPKPDDSNIYYLFVVGNSQNPGFFYYTIDLSQNGGLGSVVSGPIDLNNSERSNWTERVTAIQSNKSNEFWIISASNTRIYAYKATKDGVETRPVISAVNGGFIENRGSLKVSPDGSKLVITSQDSDCLLFDFNTSTGTASNRQVLNISFGSYGAEFSQTGNRLYISTGGHNQSFNATRNDAFIYQYDLTQNNITDINNSRTTINTWNGYRGALQLGPDARIYYAKSDESSLGVINKPEELGSNVDYVHNGISLGSKKSSEGLPPFIQSFFKVALLDIDTGIKIAGELSVCIGESKNLGINNILDFDDTADLTKPITYKWYKDDTLLTGETNSIITVGTTNKDTNGIYTLKTTYFNNCGRERSLEAVADVQFTPKPTINDINIYQQCDFDSNPNDFITNFNLTIKESELYTGTDTVSIEFFELSDTTFSSPVNKNNYRNSIATTAVNGNHKLVVKITNTTTNCHQTKEIELKVNPSGVSSYPDIYASELDVNIAILNSRNSLGSSDSYYNFDTKTQDIISNSGGALNLTTHSFSYFRTKEDAGLQNNEILPPYENHLFNDGDDIFVRISLTNSNSCESIGQFKFNILQLPIPQGNINEQILCVNNPIDKPQLITLNLDANTGNNSDTYKWYLDNQLISGATNATFNANKTGTYKVEAFREYENNPAINSDNIITVGYNSFTVKESNIASIETVEFVDDQDSLDENTLTIKVSGIGNYEFALNSNDITKFEKGDDNLSYTFTNVPPGLNKVYIRDINNCGEVSSQEVSLIYFQRHFTPNGDGNLDTWNVLGTNNAFYSEINLKIFDRYGKLLEVIDQKSQNGWNGIYNGKLLPSNDYWYNAVLIDINGNVRTKNGHFSLLRK
ncbi:T9SS type B sorting domain-containing protein [Polaribacter sp. Z022]|uniref:T9SS type B sorting domain-containing protein n=1 Tax=Polaribacter sp. Z022 TaxID=2927125 RepID=UPI0020224608|nr:T9SS type B sorting domain-containing protein [Polaribacter sp. Z022]MCL7753236.1 T9SS type B sorting domain-containing protein [Polaribacter sp. Z022]